MGSLNKDYSAFMAAITAKIADDIMRPTLSPALKLQQTGRILRMSNEKHKKPTLCCYQCRGELHKFGTATAGHIFCTRHGKVGYYDGNQIMIGQGNGSATSIGYEAGDTVMISKPSRYMAADICNEALFKIGCTGFGIKKKAVLKKQKPTKKQIDDAQERIRPLVLV